MILLSLEDPKDIALRGGGKRVRNRTHLRGHLTVGSVQANKQYGMGGRTLGMRPRSVSMLGDICVGITGEFW